MLLITIIKSPLLWLAISAIILILISKYKRLYGYIIKEHLLPLCLSIFVMIFILLAQFLIKNIDKFLQSDLGISILFEMVYYNMAWVLALAIPMAILVCTLMAFGRLSADNEITALKTSGVKYYSLLIPPATLGILVAIVMICFNNWVLPDMNYKARNLISNIAKTNPEIGLKGKSKQLIDGALDGHIIYYNTEKNEKYKNSFIIEYGNKNIIKTIISKYARIIDTYDKNNKVIMLEDGYIYEDLNNNKGDYRTIKFDKNVIKVDTDNFSFQRKETKHRGDRELTFEAIKQKINSFEDKISNAKIRIQNRISPYAPNEKIENSEYALKLIKSKINSAKKTDRNLIRTYKNIEQGINHDKSQIESNNKLKNKYLVELHKKFSIPIACIVFIIVGAPIGIATRKGKFAISMAISLTFFLIYWAFLIAGENFADKGKIDPILSMWLPNIVLLIIGIYFNIKINKEQKIFASFNFFKKLKLSK